jgi:hypothetical protein
MSEKTAGETSLMNREIADAIGQERFRQCLLGRMTRRLKRATTPPSLA